MVVKGIIKSIDVQGNTCTVRMPYFENVGNDEIVATATVSNSPGSYNGYKVNDVVWVAFENDQLECPVIIGKLYLGIEAERADPRGTLNVVDSKISRTAEIPFDTKLSRDIEPGMPKTVAPYNSLNSIANNLSTAEVNIAQNDREYGNRFSLAFENIEGNKSLITQTADRLSTEIDERIDADGVLKSTIEQTAEKMVAKVSGYKKDEEGNYELDGNGKYIPEEFGWDLQSDKWTVFSQDGEILKADQKGLTVTGTIEAEDGHIGSFIIGKEDTNGHSGIYSDTYITKYSEIPGTSPGVYVGTDGIKLGSNFSVSPDGELNATQATISGTIEVDDGGHIGSFEIGTVGENGESGIYSDSYIESFNETASGSGIYVGTDGIKLGPNFSVDTTGHVTATSITLQPSNISGLEQTLNGIDNSISNINNAGYQTASQVTQITDSRISTAHLSADQITTGSLTIGDKFSASIDNSTVNIGGFTVGNNKLTNLLPAETADVNKGKRKGVGMSAAESSHCWAFWAGHQSGDGTGSGYKALGWDAPFRVSHQGELVATSAAITGNITAETLNITEGATVTGLNANHINVKGLNANGITVNSKDSNENDIVIFSANATEGEVTLGNFTITDDKLRGYAQDIADANKKWHVAISGNGIFLGQSEEDSDDAKFSVGANGNLYAKEGTFSGAIISSNGEFSDVNKFNYTGANPASFSSISAEEGIVTNLRSDSLTINDCVLTAHGGAAATKNSITFSATASTSIIGNGTSRKYTVTVNVKKGTATYKLNAAKTVTVSQATWSDGVYIPQRTVTIPAGSSSISYSTTKNIMSGRDFVMLDHEGNVVTPIKPLNSGINNIALGGSTPTSPTGLTVTPSVADDYAYSSTGMDINKIVYATELRMTMDSAINPSKSDITLYKPIVNATGDTAENAIQYLWGFTTDTIEKRKWVSQELPDKMKKKVVSVVVSAVFTHGEEVGKDDTNLVWTRADQAYVAANYWYTDWDDDNVYVYNASAANAGRISVLVCSK